MWYRSGTVSVTNGSTAVAGSGTDWISGAGVGESFYGPDGRLYEIAAITSATTLTLGSVYLGATTSGQVYQIVPTQSYIRDLAAQAAQLVADYGNVVSNVGAGKFQDGTAAAPGIRFTADENVGIRRAGTDDMRLVANGVDQATITGSGVSIPTLTSNPTLSAGTANGVLHLNGSKVATSGSALTFDGTNLGIGVALPTYRIDIAGTNPRIRLNETTGYVLTSYVNNVGQFDVGRDSAAGAVSGASYAGFFDLTGNYPIVWRINAAEQMRLTSTGLGIGTSSPGFKLDVVGHGRLRQSDFQDVVLQLSQGASTTGNQSQILFQDQLTNTTASITAYGSAFGSDVSGALRLGTVGGYSILDSSGNLGLGVTPSAWASWYHSLDMLGGGTYASSDAAFLAVNGHNFFYNGSNYVYKANGGASMYTQGSANHAWHTAPSGTAGNPITFTQAMTLDASGNLLLGVTSADVGKAYIRRDSTTLPIVQLQNEAANGQMMTFRTNGNSQVGSISFTSSTTAYNTSSDYRLKEIAGPITSSGNYIDSLNPVEGTWKADGSTFVGLIAHEVQEVSRTQVATGEKDGEQMQAMDYSNSELIANLIAEVKSLRARVAQLESN